MYFYAITTPCQLYSHWFQHEFLKLKYETKYVRHAKIFDQHMDIDFYTENIKKVPTHKFNFTAQFKTAEN